MPDEFGSRHPRQAALDQRAMGSRRVQLPKVRQPARIHVHAAQVQSLSGPLVQLAVHPGQDLLLCRADRAPRQGNQIEITDTRDVIACGKGTGHQQIGYPAKVVQTFGKVTDDRRRVGHPARLRAQIALLTP